MSLLEVEDLQVSFATQTGTVQAVQGVSLKLSAGATLGIVGESGSGKTVLSRSIMGLPVGSNASVSGTVWFDGVTLLGLPLRSRRTLWGNDIAVVLQDPMTSLNPVMRVGSQITEVIRLHLRVSRQVARRQALDLLDAVGIPDPQRRINQYPHELSGGMQQRVTIAIALACDPKLLIADEPTTALDVTVQAQILELLHELQSDRSMAMVLISHDLGVVSQYADRVAVMYAGKVVETAPTKELLSEPRMPYTGALMASVPRLEQPAHTRLAAIGGRPPGLVDVSAGCAFAPRCRNVQDRCHESAPPLEMVDNRPDHLAACYFPLTPSGQSEIAPESGTYSESSEQFRDDVEPLLELDDVHVSYPVGRKRSVRAVAGISLQIAPGETLGLVGESGCGKSSVANAIAALPPPSSGRIVFDGIDLATLSEAALRPIRQAIQGIFQDPVGALNPRRRVRDIVAEPFEIWGRKDSTARVGELLDAVGLDPEVVASRRPHELSGGQCQRVAIARALALEPRLLICDEPVSALDVSVQAQILNLLEDLKQQYGLTMFFIAHDLAVVKTVSDRVAVMYLGKLCELGPSEQLYSSPRHPYTAALITAIPPLETGQRPAPDSILPGTVPSPLDPPSGCRFRTRCPIATDHCAHEEPALVDIGGGRSVACHYPLG